MNDTDHAESPLAARARRFLAAQRWCARVLRVTPVLERDGLGIFRCSLVPASPEGDVMAWVVVGDVPSAVVPHAPGDDWPDALHGYLREVTPRAEAVRDGRPLAGEVPAELPRAPEGAGALLVRLDALRALLPPEDG